MCIFASPLEKGHKFFENIERENEVKEEKQLISLKDEKRDFFVLGTAISCKWTFEKENKSERRMPWLLKAKKDVVSCEKLRGSANRN